MDNLDGLAMLIIFPFLLASNSYGYRMDTELNTVK